MDLHMMMVIALAVVTTAICGVILCFWTYSRKHLSKFKSNRKTVPNSSGIEATVKGILPTSSSFSYQWTYDVFINFRGEDTRHGFTGHLYNTLKKAGVRTFFDDEEIRKGDEITPTLVKAIENSRMAITVFSKNYASSTFCLNELVKIHECIKMKGRFVLPIFYDVEPSEVRHQKKNYKQAISMHIKNLRLDEDMIQSWKLALHKVANISGDHFIQGKNNYEYQFIEKIVKEISDKISRVPLHVATYPIGLESRVLAINSLLQVESNDKVIMVGICGIGGIGKTTIARAVYNLVADTFEDMCFYHDVKENSEKLGLARIQETILLDILGVDIKIQDPNKGVEIIKRRFQQKRILLVLDNVDKYEQLKILAGDCGWFGAGSRIIITTKNRHLLATHGVQSIYNIEAFNPEESRELLSYNAFRNPQIDSSYKDVLNHAASYAQGLPLALEVIGSNLYQKPMNEWESALDTYKLCLNKDIQKVLRVSYEDLEQIEKEIFLDIACFFKGKALEYVKNMVEAVYDSNNLSYSIGVLVDKCLIKIENGHGIIEIHDLIRDMGREIVREESPNNPGERSRLWLQRDIVDVLEDNTGTEKVSMIILDNWMECMKVESNEDAFNNMKGLKILIFKNVKFLESPKNLPNSIKVLEWEGYPYSCFPPNFCPKKLVVLEIGKSNLSLLEPIKTSKNLGVLNLTRCQNVTKIPDLSNLQSLKELVLEGCKNLIEIHDSIGNLANLEILDAAGCVQLKTFPSSMKSPSLRILRLGHCSSLKYFPEILVKMKIENLSLAGTGIEKLPRSIGNLSKLSYLAIYGSKSVMEIPNNIFLLPGLENISVRGKLKITCDSMEVQQHPKTQFQERLPHIVRFRNCNLSDNDILTIHLTRFYNWEKLDLTGNNFTILPSWIEQCHSLTTLILNECKHLRDVKGIPPNIERLDAINCVSLSSDSKNLILSEELHGDLGRYTDKTWYFFCVPSRSMPEWFEHRSKGASISFWFRNSFPPAVCLCFLFQPKDGVLYSHHRKRPYFTLRLYINEEAVGSLSKPGFADSRLKQFDDHHIVVYHLTQHIIDKYECNTSDDDEEYECNTGDGDGDDDDELEEHECNPEDGQTSVDHILDYEIERHDWIHVEVMVTHVDGVVIEESGMHVIIKHPCDMEHIRFENPNELLDSTSDDQGRKRMKKHTKSRTHVLRKYS